MEGVGEAMKVVKISMMHRKRRNYWQDINNIDHELRTWMWRHQVNSRLPKHRELKQSGYSSLSRAIVDHGGLIVFASRLGIPCFYTRGRRPSGYWSDLRNIEKELKVWFENHSKNDEFPTREELRETGDHCLAEALRYHGGVEELSMIFNKKRKRHGRKYWENDVNFKNELWPVLEKVRN